MRNDNYLALTLQSLLNLPFEPPTETRAAWLSATIGLSPGARKEIKRGCHIQNQYC